MRALLATMMIWGLSLLSTTVCGCFRDSKRALYLSLKRELFVKMKLSQNFLLYFSLLMQVLLSVAEPGVSKFIQDNLMDGRVIEMIVDESCLKKLHNRDCCKDWRVITDPEKYEKESGCRVKCCEQFAKVGVISTSNSNSSVTPILRQGTNFGDLYRCLVLLLQQIVVNNLNIPEVCCTIPEIQKRGACRGQKPSSVAGTDEENDGAGDEEASTEEESEED